MTQQQLKIPQHVALAALQEWLVPATENGEIDQLWNAFLEELAPYAEHIARRILAREMPQRIDDSVMLDRVDAFMTHLIDELELMTITTLEDARRRGDAVSALRDWAFTIGNRPSATPAEATVSADTATLFASGDVP